MGNAGFEFNYPCRFVSLRREHSLSARFLDCARASKSSLSVKEKKSQLSHSQSVKQLSHSQSAHSETQQIIAAKIFASLCTSLRRDSQVSVQVCAESQQGL